MARKEWGKMMATVFDLRNELDALYGSNYELDVASANLAILTVIHDSFLGLTRSDRLAPLDRLFTSAGLKLSIAELYTEAEARERGISISSAEDIPPANWDTAISMIASGKRPVAREAGAKPRRVVFYSYKGGVGRTTALVHAAFHLARSGERVAIVDLDVEAPGLHKLLPRPDGGRIEAGIVDFLWERQVLPISSGTDEALTTCLVGMGAGGKKAISYVVEDQASRAQVHVIPAGVVGDEYVRRLLTLSSEEALTRADDAWTLFEKELVDQIDPDVLLIDARTGLGDWGGLSLLRLADEVFLVMFPSEQNGEGIKFVRETLRSLSNVNTNIVLSPIPEGPVGKEIVAKFLPQLELDEEELPTEIYYNPGVAAAITYPLEAAMPGYARIANILLDSEAQDKAEVSIGRINRWKIIESLSFPEREAKAIAAKDFEQFFQKTSDFDKFLDDARWVVRGRKGTGKSTLFHLFVEHRENAVKRARGRLEGIDILPGHGPAAGAKFRPTTDVFEDIQRGLSKERHDWLTLWRAYAIVRIYVSNINLIDSILRAGVMRPLREFLNKSFSKTGPGSSWKSIHTTALLGLLSDPYKGLCRDLMIDLNAQLNSENRKLWLLYDDLDQDIKEDSPWQEDALSGLLRLAYDSNNQDIHNIRFKIFLREDIWGKLVFTNKSHFSEPRTLLLQWKIDDFLRLAYRLVMGGSPEFRSIAHREFPLTDAEVDMAGEEDLRQALVPLWGLRQEKGKNATVAKWVYNRMTDAQDNTYPRSLTVLLHAAKEEELRVQNDKAAPNDRLLSPRSMQVGLKAASSERVNALKNEYPLIRPFLEDIENNKTLRSQFNADELRDAWSRCGEPFGAFDSFISNLSSAGLLVKKKPGASFEFGIASLYIDGLGVTRVQGEKK
ncbi:AAA family ATPase [Pseudomonas aeruginosa]|uniref:tyrosine-protein kinase family protein n=2 Tax=Pseudomonas aeruginosa TaxID=287 RepID=UPI0013653E95|nr:AAA family ATPase [Pseudomonas aeruginosa]MDY1356770.1 AAA family ATPase [Pseudomonas aeruginosa]